MLTENSIARVRLSVRRNLEKYLAKSNLSTFVRERIVDEALDYSAKGLLKALEEGLAPSRMESAWTGMAYKKAKNLIKDYARSLRSKECSLDGMASNDEGVSDGREAVVLMNQAVDAWRVVREREDGREFAGIMVRELKKVIDSSRMKDPDLVMRVLMDRKGKGSTAREVAQRYKISEDLVNAYVSRAMKLLRTPENLARFTHLRDDGYDTAA